jgi:hypothetical protein
MKKDPHGSFFNVSGSVKALTAAVTMDTNNVSVCSSGGGFPHSI